MMEAKDTVMTQEQIDALWLENWNMIDNLPPSFEVWKKIYPLAQAEISFKAGRTQGQLDLMRRKDFADSESFKAGIREVVEFVEGEIKNRDPADWYSKWQAQKKEWGI